LEKLFRELLRIDLQHLQAIKFSDYAASLERLNGRFWP
jgi:hypothetical protein